MAHLESARGLALGGPAPQIEDLFSLRKTLNFAKIWSKFTKFVTCKSENAKGPAPCKPGSEYYFYSIKEFCGSHSYYLVVLFYISKDLFSSRSKILIHINPLHTFDHKWFRFQLSCRVPFCYKSNFLYCDWKIALWWLGGPPASYHPCQHYFCS